MSLPLSEVSLGPKASEPCPLVTGSRSGRNTRVVRFIRGLLSCCWRRAQRCGSPIPPLERSPKASSPNDQMEYRLLGAGVALNVCAPMTERVRASRWGSSGNDEVLQNDFHREQGLA